MSLSLDEQEVIISKCRDEHVWCVTSSDAVYTRRLRSIAAAAGVPVRELNEHTIRVDLPLRCVLIRRVPAVRILTEEQQARLVERGRQLAGSVSRKPV